MSPTLEEGNHTITLSELDNIDVDYAIVAVGNQTTVQGKDILVDDTSNAIAWTGDWQTNTSTLAHIARVFVDITRLGTLRRTVALLGILFLSSSQVSSDHTLRFLQLNTVDRDERVCVRSPEDFYNREQSLLISA